MPLEIKLDLGVPEGMPGQYVQADHASSWTGIYSLFPTERLPLPQVVKLTGIPARQLRLLDKLGIVGAQGRGRNRSYAPGDVIAITIVDTLRRKGFPVQRMRAVVEFLQKQSGELLTSTGTKGAFRVEVIEQQRHRGHEAGTEIKVMLVNDMGIINAQLSVLVRGPDEHLDQNSLESNNLAGLAPSMKRADAEPNSLSDRRLLKRYHHLIDKRLKGALSAKEGQELQRIEEALQSFEDARTSETEKEIEQRHQMMMQQLGDLTAELRRFRPGERPRSRVQ